MSLASSLCLFLLISPIFPTKSLTPRYYRHKVGSTDMVSLLEFRNSSVLPTQGRKYRYGLTVEFLEISGSTDPLVLPVRAHWLNLSWTLGSTKAGSVILIWTHWMNFSRLSVVPALISTTEKSRGYINTPEPGCSRVQISKPWPPPLTRSLKSIEGIFKFNRGIFKLVVPLDSPSLGTYYPRWEFLDSCGKSSRYIFQNPRHPISQCSSF
jgi:hypothetical protein